MQSAAIITTVVVLLLWGAWAWAREAPQHLAGSVEYVYDGDTISLDTTHGRLRVRLAGIDAPESNQPGGSAATAALRALVHGRTVTVHNTEHDDYGRIVGRIYLGDLDVSREMVHRGHAWVYRRYTRDGTLYQAEREAQSAGRGLWRASSPTPPWEWRRK